MAGLTDKVVLITGASSGIGATTAEEFARYGAKLAIHGRNAERLQSTADRCKAAGASDDKIFKIIGDVCEEDDCKRIVEDTVEHFGQLDVLVNNAGTLRTMCFWNSTTENFMKHIDWNVKSMYMVCKYAMPHLYETKGNVINMGSISALRPYNTLFPYSVAKAASDQLTKALSLEAGPKGVRVNAVDPGTITDTDVWRVSGICPTEEKAIAHENKSKPLYPLLRTGKTIEVARVIAFLASDDASFIHGVQFPIDGGITCMSQALLD